MGDGQNCGFTPTADVERNRQSYVAPIQGGPKMAQFFVRLNFVKY